MKKIISFLIWSVCFIVLLMITDQFLLRYPGSSVPVLSEFQQFYQSFRRQLFQSSPPKDSNPETVSAGSHDSPPAVRQPVAPQYIYVDQDGQLNFASSMEEIPRQFRDAAEPLKGE
nr:hypothetical protein [uncultured Desulfuromonas sp.]